MPDLVASHCLGKKAAIFQDKWGVDKHAPNGISTPHLLHEGNFGRRLSLNSDEGFDDASQTSMALKMSVFETMPIISLPSKTGALLMPP